MRFVEVDRVVRDEGTVVVLEGRDIDSGEVVEFAADHRMAQVFLDYNGLDVRPVGTVEAWQVLRVSRVGMPENVAGA